MIFFLYYDFDFHLLKNYYTKNGMACPKIYNSKSYYGLTSSLTMSVYLSSIEVQIINSSFFCSQTCFLDLKLQIADLCYSPFIQIWKRR